MSDLTAGYAARDAAAEAARARIDQDRARAEPGVRRALLMIRDRLFDPGLTVRGVLAATGNTHGELFSAFRRATDESPGDYMAGMRLDVAACLLRETDLRVGDLAMAVGYESLVTFRARFRKRFGLPPGRYRHTHASRTDAAEVPPAVEAKGWQEVFAGWSDLDRDHRRAGPASALDLEASGRRRAEQAWNVARGLTATSRRQLAISVGRTTPPLPELLFERSRIEGRGDRSWGVEVAELALLTVPPHTNDAWTVEHLRNTRIRAHAWLGNAHRLRLDFPRAEVAFGEARRLIDLAQGEVSDHTLAECAWLEAALCWFQSRFDRGLALADQAVGLASGHRVVSTRLASLRVRSAIHYSTGNAKKSIRDLEACLEALGTDARAADKLPIQHTLAECYLLLRDANRAADTLAAAEALREQAGDERAEAHVALSRGRLAWLEGDLARARGLVVRALRAFEARDDRFYVIAALTDLCTLELEAGEDAKALDHARQLLPALRFLGADTQWRELVKRLGAQVARRRLELALLRRIRRLLPRFVPQAAAGL